MFSYRLFLAAWKMPKYLFITGGFRIEHGLIIFFTNKGPAQVYFPTTIWLQKPRKYTEFDTGGVPDKQAINETPYFIGFFLSDVA